MSNLIIPAMVKSWIDEMQDKKQPLQARHNRYMMLQYVHAEIGKELEKYDLESNFRK